MSDSVRADAPFLYGRVWLHWMDTDEVRELSGRALRLWVLLLAHAAGKEATDPFKDVLARESGIHVKNLKDVFIELEQAGLLERLIGSGYGEFGRKSTQYKLLSPPSVRQREAAAQDALRSGAGRGSQNDSPPQGVKKDHRGAKTTPSEAVKKDPPGGVKTTPDSGINSQDPPQEITHSETPAGGVCGPQLLGEEEQNQAGAEADVPAARWTQVQASAQLQVDAEELVKVWLRDIRLLNRLPLPPELRLARTWIRTFGKDRAWEIVRAADDVLIQKNLIHNTISFCGLKPVVGEDGQVLRHMAAGRWA